MDEVLVVGAVDWLLRLVLAVWVGVPLLTGGSLVEPLLPPQVLRFVTPVMPLLPMFVVPVPVEWPPEIPLVR